MTCSGIPSRKVGTRQAILIKGAPLKDGFGESLKVRPKPCVVRRWILQMSKDADGQRTALSLLKSQITNRLSLLQSINMMKETFRLSSYKAAIAFA